MGQLINRAKLCNFEVVVEYIAIKQLIEEAAINIRVIKYVLRKL